MPLLAAATARPLAGRLVLSAAQATWRVRWCPATGTNRTPSGDSAWQEAATAVTLRPAATNPGAEMPLASCTMAGLKPAARQEAMNSLDLASYPARLRAGREMPRDRARNIRSGARK
jgi:hypothetical protein